jgi:hypothetical protein
MEERLASLEARMERIDDLFALIGELRADIKAIDIKFDRKFDGLHHEMHVNFRWIVGIQLMTLTAIVAALIQVAVR